MSKTKKVRCPHCGEICSYDIEAELEIVVKVARKAKTNQKKPPKQIVVTCCNPKCGKKFKISV